MAINIALELGTSYTTIFVDNYNIVLREPTAVAFLDNEENTVRAVGEEALKMQGKTGEKINVVFPVSDGYVSDPESATLMLAEFIKKIFPTRTKFFAPTLKAILSIPTGLSVEERKTYEDILVKAGINKVEMVDKVLLGAIGADLPISDGGVIIASIGGGCSEIALVGMYSVISGCSINVGGNMMDRAIIDYIVGKYGIKISKATASRLKEETASLYVNDIATCEVKGLNTDTLTPTTVKVCATDLYETLQPYYERICDGILGIINDCPPALAESLHNKGVFVVGGGAKIPGLKEMLAERIPLPVTIVSEPEYASVSGGGKLVSDKDLMDEINAQ
ncbi:MAG: rod shape-determining protein [Clostridia bacterium]|nr:rod shape-determining protein [Clostridia bacterium]